MRHRRRDGSVMTCWSRWGAGDRAGDVHEVFGFAVDVTERAALERRTAEAHQRERLRQIVEALPRRDLDCWPGWWSGWPRRSNRPRVLLLLEDGVLRVRASRVDPADAARCVQLRTGFAGRVAATRRPWVVGDLSRSA
jgi:PAS domain-containing protein